MDNDNNAVTAPVTPSATPAEPETTGTDSAPVEQTPEDTSVSSPEKAEITPDESSEASKPEAKEGDAKAEEEKTVPYSRFQEKVRQAQELERKARLLDKLQQDPEFAKEVLQMQREPEDPQVKAADEQLKKMGYMKASEAQQIIQQTVDQRLAAKDFADKVMDLEKKYDGSDGKPKFVVDDVLGYMDTYGMTDPEVAYEVKFKDQLADIRAKERISTPATETPGQQATSVPTNNREALLKEARETGDYTKVIQMDPTFQKIMQD